MFLEHTQDVIELNRLCELIYLHGRQVSYIFRSYGERGGLSMNGNQNKIEVAISNNFTMGTGKL